MHVESVAWIAERKDVMYAFFYLSALICYCYYRIGYVKKYYGLLITAFILSLLVKPMGVTLPLLLFVFDYLADRRADIKMIVEKIPLIFIAVILLAVNMYGLQISISQTDPRGFLDFPDNIFRMCYVVVFYVKKFMFPINLSGHYPYPENPINLFYPVFVTMLTLAVILSARRTRKVVFGSLFFLITLLPVLQFFKSGPALVCDRYTYVPYIGLFYIAGEWGCLLYDKAVKNIRGVRYVIITLIVLVLGICSVLSRKRIEIWKDDLTFASDIVNASPLFYRGYINRGWVYLKRNDQTHAFSDFDKAIELYPDEADCYLNRGRAYSAIGDFNRALSDFDAIIMINPYYARAYCEKGKIYEIRDDYKQALEAYNTALEINDKYAEVFRRRGHLYYIMGDRGKALSDCNMAITLNRNYHLAYYLRGIVYNDEGKYDLAISDFNRILRLKPNEFYAYLQRGIAYLKTGEAEKAILDFNKIIENRLHLTRANYSHAYYNRGLSYADKGEFAQAISDCSRAIDINPKNIDAYNQRALLNLRNNNYDKVRDDIQAIKALNGKVLPELIRKSGMAEDAMDQVKSAD